MNASRTSDQSSASSPAPAAAAADAQAKDSSVTRAAGVDAAASAVSSVEYLRKRGEAWLAHLDRQNLSQYEGGLIVRDLLAAQPVMWRDYELGEGVMAVAIAQERGKVVMHFAEPTAWIGFTPDQAMEIAQLLIKHARAAGLTKPAIITL